MMKTILSALLLLLAVSRAPVSAAEPAPESPLRATIGELTSRSAEFLGRKVIVKARVTGSCAGDGCLLLKDGFEVMEGVPPADGFKSVPKTGTTLDVTGTVQVRGTGESRQVMLLVASFEEVKK